MVGADNDEEQEELMQRETVKTGHKLTATLLIGREIRVGPKSLGENTFRGRLKLVQKSSGSSEKR